MKIKYLALAALAAIGASCSNDESFDNLKDTPITIQSAGVAELATRVITDGKLVGTSDGGSATMSVFITEGTDTKYKADNMKWEHDGTAWSNQSESTVLYEGTGSSQKIYACSPYNADAASGSVTVTAVDQTDWLVATTQSLSSNEVTLTMTHALTKLVLVPTLGTELTDQTITSVKVGDMYASGTLNISDNTWTLGDSPATTELTMTDNELLVIPMSDCTSFPITITMADSRIFKTTINCPVISPEDAETTVYGLAAGTQYNIKLQIGQDKVTLGSITAASWEVPDDEGELETE